MQSIAAPAHPPLIPEGEPVADPERVIAGIDTASPVNATAFSPDGRLLASGSYDNSVRLWDPATGTRQSILLGSRDGLWASCDIVEGRCWRHDDGTLLTRKSENGRMKPIPVPPTVGDAKLEIELIRQQASDTEGVLSPGDGRSVQFALRVRNPGTSPAYWLHIHQERGLCDPLLFTPPPIRVRLGPGETWEPKGSISYLAARLHPTGLEGLLTPTA